MFKSTLNYIFKTKDDISPRSKIDSSSAVLKTPLEVINQKKKEKGVELYKGDTLVDLALQEYGIESTLEINL